MVTPEEHGHAVELHKKLTQKHHAAYSQWKDSLKDSPFDAKMRELIMLAVGIAIRCQYCMDSHSQKARAFGATDEEVAHVIWLTSQAMAGSALSHGVDAFLSKPVTPKTTP